MPSMNEFPPWAGCVCANGSIRPTRRLCTAGATRDRGSGHRSSAENTGFARSAFRLSEHRRAPIVRRRDRKERSYRRRAVGRAEEHTQQKPPPTNRTFKGGLGHIAADHFKEQTFLNEA